MSLSQYRIANLLPFLEADNGGGGGAGDDGTTDPPKLDAGKTMTQAEIDAIVEDRLARERKKYADYDELKSKAAEFDKTQDAQKTELQQAQDKATQAEQARDRALSAANTRLIRAEAKVQASALGVKAERIDYALRLADLSGVTVGDDGNADGAAIKAALEAVLKDLPELKGSTDSSVGSGTNPAGGGSAGEKNPWLKEHFNLTEQARLLREKPALAQQMQAAAKG